MADGFGYFFIFVREDEELDGLPYAVHVIIQHNHGDNQHAKAEYHLLRLMEYEIAGRNDGDVTEHEYTSQGDVFVFVDDGGNDVRASRAAVAEEDDGQSYSFATCAEHTGHESLVAQYLGQLSVFVRNEFLEQSELKGQGYGPYDGLDAEFDGAKVSYGDKVKVTGFVGKADASDVYTDEDDVAGKIPGDLEVGDAKSDFGLYDSEDRLYAVDVTGKIGVVDAYATYYKVDNGMDQDLWNVGVAFPVVKDLKLSAEWMYGSAD